MFLSMPQDYAGKRYTYADYSKWDRDFRCEAYDGQIVNMTPAPTPKHQQILVQLSIEFGSYLRGRDCLLFTAPIDFCLFAEKETPLEDIKDWVQPDLLVVCDKNKIGEKRIIGAPDLVIEILSPSTFRTDRLIKYNKYEEAGVKEYWLIDPLHESVEVFLLEDDTFKRARIVKTFILNRL